MKNWSIKSWLLALIMAMTIPFLALLAYSTITSMEHSKQQARESLIVSAEVTASGIEQLIVEAKNTLARLAARPLMRQENPIACDPIFDDFLDLYPQYANLGMSDLSGRIVCDSASGHRGQASVANQSFFKRMVETGQFTVGEPFIGPITGKWVVVMIHPRRNVDGRLIGGIGLPLDLVPYQTVINRVKLPQGGMITIIDSNGVVIARSIEPERWVGKQVRGTEVVEYALAHLEGYFEGKGLDGNRSIFGFTTIPTAGWNVYVGIPIQDIMGSAYRDIELNLLVFGAIFFCMVILGLFLSRGVGRSVRSLATAAEGVTRGQLSTRAVPSGPREIATLAVRFNEMLEVRRQAEEELRENDIRLKLALESARMGVWVWTIQTNAVQWSPECFEICGVTSLTGELDDFTKMVHPEDIAQVMESVNRAIADRTIFACEFRFIHPDGSLRWLSDLGQVEYDAEGRPLQVVGTVQDITERKRVEEGLRGSEERLRLALDAARMGTFDWDILHDQITWSRGHEVLFGLGPGEFGGTYEAFEQRVHPEDLPVINAEVARCIAARDPFAREFRIVWPDSSVHWVVGRGEFTFSDSGKAVRMRGVALEVTERKRAEEALRASRELLNNIIDSTPSYIFAIDLRHRYILANNALGRLFGTSKEEILGKTEHDMFPRSIADALTVANDQIMATGTPLQTEEVVVSKAGSVPRVVATNKFPLRDAEGKICGLGGVATDITDRKRGEEALRDSEASFRTLFEQAAVGVAQIETDTGRFAKVNRRYCEIVGYTAEEMQRLTFQEITHPEDLQSDLDNMALLHRGEISNFSMEKRCLRKDGAIVWVNLSVSAPWNFGGSPAFHTAVVEDITERKRSEEALRESSRFNEQILLNAKEGIIVFDRDLRYVLWNAFMEKLTDVPAGDLLGKHPDEIFPFLRDLGVVALLERALAGETVMIPDIQAVERRSGGKNWTAGKASPFRGVNGKINGVLVIVSDITERKRTEEELKKSNEQLRVLSRLLVETQESERRNIALELHDQIGQVLTGLKLTLEMCLRRPVDRIQDGLKEAKAMVEGLLSEVRELSLRLRPSMLDDLGLLPTLLWHFENYTAQTRVRIAFRHVGLDRRFEPQVETAAYRIFQEALTNVARHAGVKDAEVRCEADTEALRIEIEDHGVGFDSSRISPVSSGLTGMRERTELLGGNFSIETVPDSGTRVTVRLPLVMAEAPDGEEGR